MIEVSSGFVGADVEQLRALAARFETQANKLNEITVSSSAAIMVADWTGANIDRVRSEWNRTSRPQIAAMAQSCSDTAMALKRHADEQERASAAVARVDGAPREPAEAGRPGPGDMHGLLDDMKELQQKERLFRLQEVVGEDGRTRYIISLPGTVGGLGDEFNDLGSWQEDANLWLARNSEILALLREQLRAAVADHPEAEVMLVGYSQGAMLAQLIAESQDLNVKEIVTIAGPKMVSSTDYGGANITRLQHNADPVTNGTDYLRGSIFADSGRDFRRWIRGEQSHISDTTFRGGWVLEDDVHELKSGDYDWIVDEYEKSTDASHLAARERQAAFLRGRVVRDEYADAIDRVR